MADPLNAPKASEAGFFRRYLVKTSLAMRKRMTLEEIDGVLQPAPGVFEKPSTAIKGALKWGRDFQGLLDKTAYSAAEAAGLKNPEMKLQKFETNKELGKIFGGVPVKAVDTILGGKTSSGAELPVPQPVVTPDGRTVLIRPGDLEQLRRVNDQRRREGRPPLPSPLDPVNAAAAPAAPGRAVIRPTVPAIPAPAMQDTVAVARPNDKQPEPPGRPLLVRFIDP